MNLARRPLEASQAMLSGFAPLVGAAPRVLVLGSMPGMQSLMQHEYYAHPRNDFWRIMEDVLGIPRISPYPERAAALTRAGVAVWDVLSTCRRLGSLDSNIDTGQMQVNDVPGLLATFPGISLIAFNGLFAETVYRTRILRQGEASPRRVRLPSTSPAHASLRYHQKLAAWRAVLE